MKATSQEILEAALRLPDVDRAKIVQQLLETLPPDLQSAFDDYWEEELERRFREFEDSGEPGIPWSEVRDEQ